MLHIGRRHWRVCAFALAWLAAARGARADDVAPPPPAAPTPDPTSAPAAAPDDLPMVGESIVVGTRPRHGVARDPTASATVISAGDFAGEAKGVAELVSTAPGVAVDAYGGLGQLATASIRGSTANGVVVMIDGIPLESAFGAAVDLSSIPRGWIARIEVVRGAEGAHYGAGALGGVINVVTARPRSGAWSAEVAGGSFGSLGGAVEVTRLIGTGTLLLSVTGDRTDGDFPYLYQPTPDAPQPLLPKTRLNDAAWRTGAMAKAAAPLGAGILDAVALLSAGRRELPGGERALTPDDWQADGRAILAVRYGAGGPWEGARLSGRLSARYEWLDAEYSHFPVSEQFAAVGLAAEGEQRHAGGTLRLELGAQGEGAQGDGFDGTRLRARLHAAAAEELRLAGERLRLAPALRAERVGDFDGLSAKLGASWSIAGPLVLRASAGRTFRAPSEAELHAQQGLVQPNPDLQPEVGLGGDAALVVDGGPVQGSLGGHATLYRDLIYYQRVSMGRLQPFNAGKALVRGLELELATVPLWRPLAVSLSASYTFLQTEILRGRAQTLGNEVPHRARQRLYARAGVAPGPVEIHAELHYVGRQFADDSNLREIPAALVWNAGAGVTLLRDPALRLSVEVQNLLDDRELQDGFENPLPGRTLWVTLSAGSGNAKGSP